MKHTWNITVLLTVMFFAAQIAGLGIVLGYLDIDATIGSGKSSFSSLPFDMARPEIEESISYIYIAVAIIMGTALLLLLIRFRKVGLWKIWFFMAIMATMTVALSAFLNEWIAVACGVLLALWKIYRPNIYIHNLTEILVYGGLAAIFVPIINLFSAFMLLLVISIYDMYAVWRSRHMVAMAQFQTENRLFSGLFVPYGKKGKIADYPDAITSQKKDDGRIEEQKLVEDKSKRTAILGGGDIGFTLIFASVVMKTMISHGNSLFASFFYGLIVSAAATVALFFLFLKSEKGKFYPAMPFLSIGCVIGYGIVWILTASV